MYKRDEDGIVLRDEERCQGSRDCMRACPYKKIYFNHVRGVAQHCNLCFPRLEQGVAPACARNCPGRLAFVGYLDDEQGAIHKLVNEWRVALPLHAEYGTSPNFVSAPVFSMDPTQEANVEAFMMALDTGLKPAVGEQISANASNSSDTAVIAASLCCRPRPIRRTAI
jgi:nitrate reductase beta subunit